MSGHAVTTICSVPMCSCADALTPTSGACHAVQTTRSSARGAHGQAEGLAHAGVEQSRQRAAPHLDVVVLLSVGVLVKEAAQQRRAVQAERRIKFRRAVRVLVHGTVKALELSAPFRRRSRQLPLDKLGEKLSCGVLKDDCLIPRQDWVHLVTTRAW
jgi:hypothetical protein